MTDELEFDFGDESEDAGESAFYERKLNKQEREQLEARKFWKAAFSTPVGRRELWGILQATHAFEERFACGPNGFPQTEATWFHAGQQAFGQRLFLSWQVFDPEGVFLMQQEHDARFARPKPQKRRRA
jgi:hypothetical protein